MTQQIIILFIAVINLLLPSCGTLFKNEKIESGTIIFMIGTPSSGKTTLAKALQNQLIEPYLYTSTDMFVAMLPSKYIENQHKQGIYFITKNENASRILQLGPIGKKLLSGFIGSIQALANTGNNVIVEGVIWEKSWLKQIAKAWQHNRVYFIHITIPLSIAEEREKQRTDWFEGGQRAVGQVRGAFEAIESFGQIYDISIDTSSISLDKAINQIIDFMNNNPEPKAFKNLISIADH